MVKNIKSSKIRKAKKTPRAPKIKLRSAPTAETRDIAELQKQFRKLKKLGLTRSKRKATSHNVTGKFVASLLDKYSGVLRGSEAVVRVPRSKAKAYRASNKVVNNRVIVEKAPGEQVTYDKEAGLVKRKQGSKSKGYLESHILPVPMTDLEEYLRYVYDHPEVLGKLPKNGKFAFRYYGNITKNIGGFNTIESMISFISRYQSIAEAIASHDRKKQQEIFQNLEFFTTTPAKLTKEQKEHRAAIEKGRRERINVSFRKRKLSASERRARSWARDPERHEKYLARQREYARKRREKLKGK